MSTGIHMQVEWQGSSGKWHWMRKIPPWECHTCHSLGHFANGDGTKHSCWVCSGRGYMVTPYYRTDYHLFRFLCGVEGDDRRHARVSESPRGVPQHLSEDLWFYMNWLKDSRSNALFKCPYIEHLTFGGLWFNLDSTTYNVANIGEHDFSWVGLHELLPFRFGKAVATRIGRPWFDFIHACAKIDSDLTRVRLVFGFSH